MEKKQTAVDLLVSILNKDGFAPVLTDEEIHQAKQMEKEHNEYFFNCGRQYQLTGEGTFKQVHNETYGGQDE
jgi:hypothetical protein